MPELDRDLLPGPLEPTERLALSDDESLLAAATTGGDVYVWSLAPLALVARWRPEQYPHALAFLGKNLVLSGYGSLRAVDPYTGSVLHTWNGAENAWATRIATAPSGLLAVAWSHRLSLLRDFETTTTIGPWAETNGHGTMRIEDVIVDARHERVAICGSNTSFVVDFDGRELARLDRVRAIAFGEDDTIVTSGDDGSHVRSFPSCEVVRPLPAIFTHARWTRHGWLTWDHQDAKLYDVDGAEIWARRYIDGLRSAAVGTDRFYTSSHQPWIGVRSVATGELEELLPAGGGAHLRTLAFAENGELLVAGDQSGRIAVWDHAAREPRSVVDTSSLAPDGGGLGVGELGSVYAVWTRDRALHVSASRHYVWPDVTSREIAHVAPDESSVEVGTIVPMGEYTTITNHEDGTLELSQLRDGERVAVLPQPPYYSGQVVVEPGARRVLFLDDSGEGTVLRLWDVASSRYTFDLHVDAPCHGSRFAPDGSIIGWIDRYATLAELDEEDAREPSDLFFRWRPDTPSIERWFKAPAGFSALDVLFGDAGEAVVLGEDRVLVLDHDATSHRSIELPGSATKGVLHSPTGRLAVALQHGILAVVDLTSEETTLLCLTADGGRWSLHGDDFRYVPGELE